MIEALSDIINGMDRITEFLRNSKDPKHNAHECQRATIPQSKAFQTELANAYKLVYGEPPSEGFTVNPLVMWLAGKLMLEGWRSDVEKDPALGEAEIAKSILKNGIRQISKYERIYGLDKTKAGVVKVEIDDKVGALALGPKMEEDVKDERIKVEGVEMEWASFDGFPG